jgi:hypothetical protein
MAVMVQALHIIKRFTNSIKKLLYNIPWYIMKFMKVIRPNLHLCERKSKWPIRPYPDGKLKTEGYFVDGDLNFEKEPTGKMAR